MRSFVFGSILFFLLVGCSSVPFNGYAPTDTQYLVKAPYQPQGQFAVSHTYHYLYEFSEDASLTMTLTGDKTLEMTLVLSLSPNSRFYFESDELLLRNATNNSSSKLTIKDFERTFIGEESRPGIVRFYDDTEGLNEGEIINNDNENQYQPYISTMPLRGYSRASCIVVNFPNAVLNNKTYTIEPVTMVRVGASLEDKQSCARAKQPKFS